MFIPANHADTESLSLIVFLVWEIPSKMWNVGPQVFKLFLWIIRLRGAFVPGKLWYRCIKGTHIGVQHGMIRITVSQIQLKQEFKGSETQNLKLFILLTTAREELGTCHRYVATQRSWLYLCTSLACYIIEYRSRWKLYKHSWASFWGEIVHIWHSPALRILRSTSWLPPHRPGALLYSCKVCLVQVARPVQAC